MAGERKSYHYVGPEAIRARGIGRPAGVPARSAGDVVAWATDTGQPLRRGAPIAATYVVDQAGTLRIADRHSEHVACAGGGPVLAAGELVFAIGPPAAVRVEEVSNQSAGYCPEPSCWPAVAAALDAAGIPHPGGFTTECTFRRCTACGGTNLVKDGWFYCDVCGAALNKTWNFAVPGPSEP